MALFGALGLAGCGLKIDRDVDADAPRYRVTNATTTYFRNVRQTFYSAQEMPGNGMVVYRRPDPELPKDQPHLRPAIALNGQYQEAYVLIEPNAWFQNMDTVRVRWAAKRAVSEGADTAGTYVWAGGNKDTHFRFTSQLQRSLLADHRLTVVTPDDTVDVLTDREAREQFRKTMLDFYHLVGLD
ncbi:MAG: hypothetical protein WBA12_14560 [Catalinimonas sp.]